MARARWCTEEWKKEQRDGRNGREMSIALLIIGAVLLLYGISLCLISNFNVGILAVFLLGAMALGVGLFFDQLKLLTRHGLFFYLKLLVLFGIGFEAVFVGFLAVNGAMDTVTYKEDAVIILGAGIKGDQVSKTLRFRLDRAIAYAQENPEALLVVSGGQGPQEAVTEAYAMEQYLLAHGIRPERIIKEEKSTSTQENLRFSKALLDARFARPYRVAIITNGFHIFRATQMANDVGFEAATHLHAALPWYQMMPCYLRESIALMKIWLIG